MQGIQKLKTARKICFQWRRIVEQTNLYKIRCSRTLYGVFCLTASVLRRAWQNFSNRSRTSIQGMIVKHKTMINTITAYPIRIYHVSNTSDFIRARSIFINCDTVFYCLFTYCGQIIMYDVKLLLLLKARINLEPRDAKFDHDRVAKCDKF